MFVVHLLARTIRLESSIGSTGVAVYNLWLYRANLGPLSILQGEECIEGCKSKVCISLLLSEDDMNVHDGLDTNSIALYFHYCYLQVLRQPHVQRLIIGEDAHEYCSTDFQQNVFRSFLDTLVQALYTTTSDVKEVVQVGRRLWPKYIAPLGKATIEKTIESAREALASKSTTPEADPQAADIRREVLSFLDRKILPSIRLELEGGLFSLEGISRSSAKLHDLPVLTKYLVLAAFLCHVNRPDRDKHLFSIQKNGRRRRQETDRDDQEDVAFGSDLQASQSKLFRPKTFPVERMLSVYVSMVGLNQQSLESSSAAASSSSSADGEERLRSLGSTAFYENISHLRDMNLLHEYPIRSATDPIRLADPRYWTSITKEEAHKIASDLSFPLDRYIK